MTISPSVTSWFPLDTSDVPKAAFRTWAEQVEADILAGGGGGGGTNPDFLINSDFQINERAFAGGALATNIYGYDRWKGDPSLGATVSVSGYVVTLSAGAIVQVIESALWRATNFASTQFTVSIDTPSADITVTLGSTSATITAGSGRRSVTLTTGAGDTGNLAFKLAKATAGTVTFGRVKLELGNTATDWKPRSRGEEHALCQRYYQRFGSVFPGVQLRSYQTSGLYFQTTLLFPTEMRAVPSSNKAGTWGVSNCGQPLFDSPTTRSVRVSALVTATGDAYFYAVDASTYADFSAEL